ncbi:MAG TPA: phosphatase PAP2 family protein [Gaiellaceae bacterium]|nr:phosphatase PAP2 family protein [Gaiellaceae bacterium]
MVDRLRAFGLPLLAALLILAGSLWAFGQIVDEQIVEGGTTTDERFAEWLHGRATDPLTDVFHAITWTGNFLTLLVVALVAVVVLWRRRERTDALFVALAFLGGQVLSNGMKLGFRRERPFFADPLATESTFSFPSGHALVSLAVYGAIALLLARGISSHRGRALLLAATAIWVALIGFSRLYLGVHFLSDVLAGFAAGAAWLALLYLALELRSRYTSRYLASTKQ